MSKAGSGGVVERVAKEKIEPPGRRAGHVAALHPAGRRRRAAAALHARGRRSDRWPSEKDPDGHLSAAGQQLHELHLQPAGAARRAEDLRRSARSQVQGQDPVFDAGQAGDGTAVMLQVIHAFGGKERRLRLSARSCRTTIVGPSSSTGKLTALVNKGELYVANGDLQMNMSQMTDNPNIQVFWPAGPNGERSALSAALLHRPRAGRARCRQRQEADRVPARAGGAE